MIHAFVGSQSNRRISHNVLQSSSTLKSTIPDEWEGGDESLSNSGRQTNPPLSPSSTTPPGFLEEPRMRKGTDKEAEIRSRFLFGDELIELRQYMSNIKKELSSDVKKNKSTVHDLQKALYDAQQMDPEYVYALALENAVSAEKSGLDDEAAEYMKEAMEARSILPQFGLSGLWVGKYGDNGYEMINVTYSGDTLIATKVTGDKNVPKGEVTFTANLSIDAPGRKDLEAIKLSDEASKQWGYKYLPRFPGDGQVAAEGFINNQMMNGQLILVGDYFSFAWIPIGHQIFFGRPSAELTMKMLKESKMAEYGALDKGSPNVLAEMRFFIERCYEETQILMDDEDVRCDGELIYSIDDENYFTQTGCFE